MLIAFEGPDNTGKSTAAKQLTSFDEPIYNATKTNHAALSMAERSDVDLIGTFDRIDWLSHMVYRLALPDRDWNDDRPRTVFGMPDTHLVFRMHDPAHADFTADEVVDTPIARVNPVYWWAADAITRLNQFQNYTLFKSVSIIEVANTADGYTQRMMAHDNASWSHDHDPLLPRMVSSTEELLDFLREQDKYLG